MPQSLTNFDSALKDNYGPGLKNAVNNANAFLGEVKINDASMRHKGRPRLAPINIATTMARSVHTASF